MTIVDFRKKILNLAGARFVALSGLSFAMNMGVTVFLHEMMRVPPEIAFAVALTAAVITSFLGMRYYVCPSQRQNIVRQFVLFVVSSSGFRVLEYAAFFALHVGIGFPYRPVMVTTLFASLAVKYPYYKLRVFN